MIQKSTINTILLTVAGILMMAGTYLLWQAYQQAKTIDQERAKYLHELDHYSERNIYYDPQAIIDWLLMRLNPQGYFVQSPDMMFEPSQLNTHSLRATRYAISTLRELDALDKINRSKVIDWVIGNYISDLDQSGHSPDKSVYTDGRYAAFSTLEGEMYGVRPTMDAIIILESLDALDDERIDLSHLERFILAHQNEDGGFWDEHYPKFGKQSCLKCTSFALRSLGRLQRKFDVYFDRDFKNSVSLFVKNCRDEVNGGYASMPGKATTESYDSFRAYITLWWLQHGTHENHKDYIESHMQVDDLIRHLQQSYYLPEQNAYSRYYDQEIQSPSLKASHLITWLITSMGRSIGEHKDPFLRYVLANEGKAGDFGGDIYSTYSATGILKKLKVATGALPAPIRPAIIDQENRGYDRGLLLLIVSLLLYGLVYALKKSALEADYQSMTVQAMHDGLTGIYNRTKLEEISDLEIQKAQRYDKPLSLIMFDVDRFKKINDTFGHIVGDEVLKKLTELVESSLRRVDTFARWGGEEFIILVPETELKDAGHLAEKLRKLIEATSFRTIGSLTCSFGVAQLDNTEKLSQVTERADKALYTAKSDGRNCVRISDNDMSGVQIKKM
ncbi:MAG: diguanylate cyclase [Arenicellales bacterium]